MRYVSDQCGDRPTSEQPTLSRRPQSRYSTTSSICSGTSSSSSSSVSRIAPLEHVVLVPPGATAAALAAAALTPAAARLSSRDRLPARKKDAKLRIKLMTTHTTNEPTHLSGTATKARAEAGIATPCACTFSPPAASPSSCGHRDRRRRGGYRPHLFHHRPHPLGLPLLPRAIDGKPAARLRRATATPRGAYN